MSIKRQRAPQGNELWITRQNLFKRLPRDVAERILKNGVTLKLAGQIPELGKATRLRGWNSSALSEQLWRVRDYISEKSDEYKDKYSITLPSDNQFRVTLTCHRGEAPCVYAVWGDIIGQKHNLPTKWRFNAESIPYVASLIVELKLLGQKLLKQYEADREYYSVQRRRNRATVKALYRLAGVQKKIPAQSDDSQLIYNIDPFREGDLRSYEDCQRGSWPTRTVTKKNGKVAVTLAVHGNNASHIDCNLNLQFTIHDEKLRGKECWKLIQLFKAARQLLGSREESRS